MKNTVIFHKLGKLKNSRFLSCSSSNLCIEEAKLNFFQLPNQDIKSHLEGRGGNFLIRNLKVRRKGKTKKLNMKRGEG
jgi:hypothetical protein